MATPFGFDEALRYPPRMVENLRCDIPSAIVSWI